MTDIDYNLLNQPNVIATIVDNTKHTNREFIIFKSEKAIRKYLDKNLDCRIHRRRQIRLDERTITELKSEWLG